MTAAPTPLSAVNGNTSQNTQACSVLQTAYARGWITHRDGNVSVADPNGDGFWISPSGVIKARLDATQMLHVSADALAQDVAPAGVSGEFALHRLVQALLPAGYDTVLHLHPTYIVAAMFAGWDLRELSEEFPEVTRYTRVGRNVPPLAATSEELAVACARAFAPTLGQMPHIVGLDRHGMVAIGRSALEAFEHVERLEHVCQMVLASGVRPSAARPAAVVATADCA
ncbi:MAG: class II aldolase/adducin family protein [Thiomonas sp.]